MSIVTKQIESTSNAYIPGLDGIRAMAICLVLFSHSVIYDQFSFLRTVGTHAGSTGVTVFFVLSGFLITTLLLREEDRYGCFSLRLFYMRRGLRLFPALWLFLLVVWVIWVNGYLPDHPWHSFVSSLLYVRNLVGRGHETAHLWSLSIEEQFYFLWPMVLLMTPKMNRTRLFIVLILIASVTAWRSYAIENNSAGIGALYMRTDFRLDAPLFGCALAILLQVAPKSVSWLNSTPVGSGVLALLGTAGIVSFLCFDLWNLLYKGLGSTVICIFGLLLIVSQLGVQSACSRVFSLRPFVLVGQISYGLYLWQQLFLGPLSTGFTAFRTFPFGLVTTFFVAAGSYWLLELPLIRLKDRRFHRTAKLETLPNKPMDRSGGSAAS